MTGAMAGSTVLRMSDPVGTLRVVTLTVNNVCNLRCPHCYLQYAGENDLISDTLVDFVVSARFAHLAIVGKEPLANPSSAHRCCRIIQRAIESGKTVSMITNGLGLHELPSDVFAHLDWIDVSLDGGPATYESYRGASFDTLVRNLQWVEANGYNRVNALNTLSSRNACNVDDIVSAAAEHPFSRIVFSPYVETLHQGRTDVDFLSLHELCRALAASRLFMDTTRTVLLLGAHAYYSRGISPAEIEDVLSIYSLAEKTVLVTQDPLMLGFVRVTYDGLILTPYESLHPAMYRQVGRRVTSPGDLERYYAEFVANAAA